MLIKGIISFPTLFTPKVAKGATDPKYSISVLLPPNDSQITAIQAEVARAKQDGCPSGYNGQDECLNLYGTKYAGKEYYDPKFTGWWAFSCTAKVDDKPSVVDMAYTPIIDPGAVFGGQVAYVNAAVSYYPKGKAGIGGWLNGIMLTAEELPMGRLDNKPSVEQMFAAVGQAPAQPHVATNGLPVNAPAPAAPVAPAPAAPAPAAPVALQMTAAANGVTYEQYMATPGWTDQMLLDQGLAIKPSYAQ